MRGTRHVGVGVAVAVALTLVPLAGAVLDGRATAGGASGPTTTIAGTTTTTTGPTTTIAGTTTTTVAGTTTTTAPGETTSTTTPSSTTSTLPPTTTTTIPPLTISWPTAVSAAIYVPDLSLVASSPQQPRVPIASITKMMTTWVVLHRLPLARGATGPCHVVTPHDLAIFHHDLATDQSNAAVAVGERLCESTLLRGLLVHSAGDFAEILVEMTGLNDAQFVALMNRDAAALGLRSTHYVDVTGIGPGDRSTALDQAHLADILMSGEPVVAPIVTLPWVRLPVAGIVSSYTPYVGQGGVVGVKSGYTNVAGGCDVMAVNFVVGTLSYRAYVVVLGVVGPNAIVRSGTLALGIARQVRLGVRVARTTAGSHLVWTGSPAYLR